MNEVLWGRLAELTAVALGVCAAIGASVRFQAWHLDRRLTAQMESAAALKTDGRSDAIQNYGRREFERLHFRRLTGLDLDANFDALLGFHASLGGGKEDWARMRKAGPFLRASNSGLTIDAPARGDWCKAGMAACGVVALLGASVWLFSASAFFGLGAPLRDLDMQRFTWAVIAFHFGALSLLFAWPLWSYVQIVRGARTLHRLTAQHRKP